MSRYDELVRIYLQAKDEYENDGKICRDFAQDLIPTVSLGVTSTVVSSCGHDSGQIAQLVAH